MKRLIVFVCVLVIGAFLYVQLVPTKSAVTVTDARAIPMVSDDTMFMVSLTMQNEGDAVTLTGARATDGAAISLINPGNGGPLVIPAGGQGLLAMDGAHLMLSVPDGAFEEGTFQSISLTFDDGSEVAARVMRPAPMDGMTMMNHGMSQGVEGQPAPAIFFTAPPSTGPDGFDVSLSLENFDFVVAPDDADHVPGEGHAHIYLNGLKLGRLYESSFRIGALLPGAYDLRVALNAHDHRPYLSNGVPVEAVLDFRIP